jgi:hypothetical protein
MFVYDAQTTNQYGTMLKLFCTVILFDLVNGAQARNIAELRQNLWF